MSSDSTDSAGSAVSRDRKVLVRAHVQATSDLSSNEDAGLEGGVALPLPWTQWTPVRRGDWRLGIELSPAANFLWRPGRNDDGSRLFAGVGVEARVTQNALRAGPFSFLDTLSVTAGYGKEPYVASTISLLRFNFDNPFDASAGTVGGGTSLGGGAATAGVEAEFPIHTIKPRGLEDVDPARVFLPVGPFQPGRVTYIYYAVELQDENGRPLHKPIPIEERIRLIEGDRQFAFNLKDSPLKGLADQVNYLITQKPVPVRVKGSIADQRGAKASDVVDLWDYHQFVQDMVAAHPEYFGTNVQAIAQVPYDLRDQFLWFRFDKATDIARTVTEGGSLEDWLRTAADLTSGLFPALSVPIALHGTGDSHFKLDLQSTKAGVPQSSVVLFHELFGHGGTEAVAQECRASDEYSEGSLEEFLREHPREAAVIRFLDQSQLVSHLTRADLARKIIGKPLGEPNVLPNEPEVIERVWGKLPGFHERLWTEGSGRPPQDGDVRIVPGGLYFPDAPFVRLQVFERDTWRDTYMKDSHNPTAPLGPIMERCLEKTADLIRKNAD